MMKQKLQKKLLTMALAGMVLIPVLGMCAEESGYVVSVTADTLEYDGKTQVATAKGNVVIVRDQATMTGDTAVYNLKTAEADMEGNVALQQPNMTLQADKVHSTDRNYVVATGTVRGTFDDKKVNGDKVEYFLDKEYGIVNGNGYVEAQGSQLWADHIDAWFKEIKAVGKGHVHIESPADNLTAYASQAVYTQTPNQDDGVVHLTGNVRAVQNGNSLAGENVIIRLGDNTVQTTNRATVVFVPDNN